VLRPGLLKIGSTQAEDTFGVAVDLHHIPCVEAGNLVRDRGEPVPAQDVHECAALRLGHLEDHPQLLGEEGLQGELIALDRDLLGPNLEIAPVRCDGVDGEQVEIKGEPAATRKGHLTETGPEPPI